MYDHKCSHICINTPGSYNCSCPDDLILSGRTNCVARNYRLPRDKPNHQQLNQSSVKCLNGYRLDVGKCVG